MLKTARNLGFAGILLALTGCSMATLQTSIEKWGKVAEEARKGLAVVNDGLERVDRGIAKVDDTVAVIKTEMKKADTDGDGKLSMEEILAMFTGGGVLGGIVTALTQRLRGSTREKEAAKLAQEKKDEELRKAMLELAIRVPAPPAPAV